MNFKFNKKDAEEIMECLYIQWDLTRENLQDREAKKLARIRDDMLEQFKLQCKEK